MLSSPLFKIPVEFSSTAVANPDEEQPTIGVQSYALGPNGRSVVITWQNLELVIDPRQFTSFCSVAFGSTFQSESSAIVLPFKQEIDLIVESGNPARPYEIRVPILSQKALVDEDEFHSLVRKMYKTFEKMGVTVNYPKERVYEDIPV